MCYSKRDICTIFNNLKSPLALHNTNQSLWSDKCDYNDIDKIKYLNPSNKNLTVL